MKVYFLMLTGYGDDWDQIVLAEDPEEAYRLYRKFLLGNAPEIAHALRREVRYTGQAWGRLFIREIQLSRLKGVLSWSEDCPVVAVVEEG